MPEEVNRVLTDRLSDLLLTPSPDAEPNLLAEGIEPERIVFVGNVMIDTLLRMLPAARAANAPASVGLDGQPYALATLHRPSNVDAPDTLRTILGALDEIARGLPVLLPLHPRTRQRIDDFGLQALLTRIKAIPPLGYTQMLGLQAAASVVITDSGGVQEETTVLGIPCVTLRESTERPITVTEGTNRLAPWPMSRESVVDTVRAALAEGPVPVSSRAPKGWDGRASERIIAALSTPPKET
jgi:UDP-N-acetylglucosamine 2-epimerase (non-hydrolysing)